MRRRRTSEICAEGSFDSFLSTVTKNGLGMLVLVAMASTFSSQLTLGQAKFKRSLGTPLIKAAPQGLKPVYLECRAERVFPIELDVVQGHVHRYFQALPFPEERKRIVEDVNALKTANDYHRFELEGGADRLNVYLKPKEGKSGFSLEDLKASQPAFGTYLQRWNPKEHYLFLDVRSDSFQVFREVRDFAKARGFQVGWYPMPADKDLLFYWLHQPGAGGRPDVDH